MKKVNIIEDTRKMYLPKKKTKRFTAVLRERYIVLFYIYNFLLLLKFVKF